jgi:hypothetical protein
MIRDGTAAGSANVMLGNLRDRGLQFARRANGGEGTEQIEGYIGSRPWVRIVRNGNAFSAFYSNDGQNWTYHSSTTASLPEDVLIGMAVSSYSSGVIGSGNFDDFILCPGEAGALEPPVIPPEEKPPGLKECVQTIELGSFEASAISPPWVRNVDAFHAAGQKHSGNFSLGFRASVGPRPEYKHLSPWAYQTVSVPGDVLPETTGILSFWQFVAPDPSGSVPDPDDHFNLVIRDSGGVTMTADIPLARGDTNTPTFQQNAVNVETYLAGNGFADLAEQDIQLKFYGTHDGQPPGTYFYMDDVRLDICTTQPIPDDVPGTASIGGLLEVWLAGVPTKMPGVNVWAYAPGGTMYATKTIHDSTYHFYNVPPGPYTIYAEVWVGGYLYTGTTEVTVAADERNYTVDLLLQ